MTLHEAFNLAMQRYQAGQWAEAEAICRQILAALPNHSDTSLNLGSLLHDLGRYDDAIEVYRQALSHSPGVALLWCNLSNSLCEADQLEMAVAAARQAITLDAHSFGAYNNLGNALKRLERLDEAIVSYQRAIELRGNFAFAHNNLGTSLHVKGDIEGAIACFNRAMELNPRYAEALSNLGNALGDKGLWEQGMDCCRRSMALRPDYPSVHWNLGLMLLRNGDFERGWPEYEWRWRVKNLIAPPMNYTEPAWDGAELSGRRILIHAEQGLGDTIQFARYLPLVARCGGRVILHCHGGLAALLGTIEGVETVVPWTDILPPFEVQCPLLSLPRIFKTTVESIPAKTPYLFAEEGLARAWGARLPAGRLKVGLVWAGRATHLNDRRRSLALANLGALAGVSDAWFCSLQVGEAAGQLHASGAGLRIADFGGDLHDFADTAALISNLDLVISVDTSVAHLAGALGRRVWVLLPFSPDWRWMLNRDDSPWYPTMRLFRQPRAGDWDAAIQEVAGALRSL